MFTPGRGTQRCHQHLTLIPPDFIKMANKSDHSGYFIIFNGSFINLVTPLCARRHERKYSLKQHCKALFYNYLKFFL